MAKRSAILARQGPYYKPTSTADYRQPKAKRIFNNPIGKNGRIKAKPVTLPGVKFVEP